MLQAFGCRYGSEGSQSVARILEGKQAVIRLRTENKTFAELLFEIAGGGVNADKAADGVRTLAFGPHYWPEPTAALRK